MGSKTRRRCALVSIGDELILGEKVDTNTSWLAQRLFAMGIEPVERVMLGDDADTLAATLKRLAGSSQFIICTGGLGPTADDLTRHGLALAMNDNLVLDEAVLEVLSRRASQQGRPMTEGRRLMATRPSRAVCLENPVGSAPGLRGQVAAVRVGSASGTEVGGSVDVYCLPGPPHEMRRVFEIAVAPSVLGQITGGVAPSANGSAVRLIHASGLPESDAAARLGELLERGRNPQVGITVSSAVVTCRVRATGPDAAQRVGEVAAEVASRLEPFVFGADQDTLEGVVIRELVARGRKLATAESCTGGMLGQMVTGVVGASRAYVGGVVTYTNEMKRGLLGVKSETLEENGAVSAEVVKEMAAGALDLLGGPLAGVSRAHHAIAVSGVAGPQGGSAEKPVGTVWIAHAWRGDDGEADGVCARRVLISGDREQIRRGACIIGLTILWFWLKGEAEPPKLVWEV